jgi:thioredoxin 1
MVSPVIEGLAHKYTGKLKVVKVNVDDNQMLAMKFNIMSIPTVMVFKGGKPLDQAIGAAPSEFYDNLLARNHVI